MPFGDGTLREGYVEVEPYWAPGTTVEVCAFDAQEAAVSPTGTRCDTPDGIGDPACGCGPGLTWCMDSSTEDRIVHGFEAEVEQRIAAVVREDRPWTDLFLDSRAYVNGPTAWYWHHLSEFNSNARLSPSAWPIERIPDMPFGAEDDWRPVILGEQHAGVLTSPAFLLRFQTRRSRANRYYTSFICSPFTPPEQGIPPTIEGVRYAMDLQVRDGCDYCHAILEPVAAAWGRWPEVGAAYLDPEQYPAYREDCRACVGQDEANCPRACRQDYVIRAQGEEELPYLGMLRSYEFRRGEHEIYVEDGPRRLVADDLAAGRLQRCATEHLFLWYLGRETGVDEWNWARQATSDFMESGYSYRALAGAILQSDAYRRAR
jgi:hypothetical protein